MYLPLILVILIGGWLLDCLADLLNLRHFAPGLPGEFEGFYDAERYRRSQGYLRANTRLDILEGAVMTAATVLFILLGGFNCLDLGARKFCLSQIPTGLIFAGSLFLLAQFCRTPFSAYRTFVIEEQFDFNRTTLKTFATDILKRWSLSALIRGGLLAAVLGLFIVIGPRAWFLCWAVIAAVQLFFVYIAPTWILPLFNTFVPLESGPLREAIERYSRQQGFAISGIFVMDASRRSGKSNAFFTGFGGSRRVVLFDTLVARHTPGEIAAVLAHEVGHYRGRHLLKTLAVSLSSLGLMLYILSLLMGNEGLFAAFRMEHLSVYA
ncbi:MAG: M48 family metallopeptidase, partial [Candidatus Aureabacteria bacterium]|nr:M48 family metallopeptidase [Candidatus Auribacterota bacterium]